MPTTGRYQNRRVKYSKQYRNFNDDDEGYQEVLDEIANGMSTDDRHFAARDGHTLRKTEFYHASCHSKSIGGNPILKRSGGYTSNVSTSLLPVTEIDFFFDRGYVEGNFMYTSNGRFRPIREALQTSGIIKALEILAINKESRFLKRCGLIEVHFDIPICGHYMPMTVDDLQAEGNGEEFILAGQQDFIANSITKQSGRKNHFNHSLNSGTKQWQLLDGRLVKKKKKNTLSNGSEGQMDKSRWLYYQGKYWDPSILYEFAPMIDDHCETQSRSLGSLRKLCPLQHTLAYQAMVQLGPVSSDSSNAAARVDIATQQKKTLTAAMVRKQFEKLTMNTDNGASDNTNVLNRLIVKTFTDNSTRRGAYAPYYASVSKKQTAKRNKHLEIDLGEVCQLTHIGFMGGYPHYSNISTFPAQVLGKESRFIQNIRFPFQNVNNRNGPKRRRIKRRGRLQQVQVVSSHSLCWVERFLVQYRDTVTRKWCDLPHELSGNSDIVHEERHILDLQARCIRVIPKEYHNSRDFSVLLYGHPLISKASAVVEEVSKYKTKKSKKGRQSRREDSSEEGGHVNDVDDDDDDNYEDIESSSEDVDSVTAMKTNKCHRNKSSLKKPFNLAECYDAVRNHNNDISREVSKQLQLRASTNATTKRQEQQRLESMLGKKMETIHYTLVYHPSQAYDADRILDNYENNSDYDVDDTDKSKEDMKAMKKRVSSTMGGSFIRLAEGLGYPAYHDYYGLPSRSKLRNERERNMEEDRKNFLYRQTSADSAT